MSRTANTLACPRCGYDVSGVVPTWTEQCPLDGTCSECGLGFAWVDIFRPDCIAPAWSFEHARKRRILALVGTLWRTWFPGTMWRDLRLSTPIGARRLLVLTILLLFTTHSVSAVVACGVRWSEIWTQQWALRGTPRTFSNSMDWSLLASLVAWPYGWDWERVIGPLCLWLIVWGALAPLPYLILEQTMAAAKVRRAHLFRAWVYCLPPMCGFVILSVLMMTLPHVWYRWTGLYLFTGWPQTLWGMLGGFLLLLGCFLLVRWWLKFTRLYLQLEQSRRIVAAMLAISMLAALVICLGFDEKLRYAVGSPLEAAAQWWSR